MCGYDLLKKVTHLVSYVGKSDIEEKPSGPDAACFERGPCLRGSASGASRSERAEVGKWPAMVSDDQPR
jgi:hypothetical protein